MFFLNVLVSGLLAGLMYGMVAIGFVLIYKASGVFNFAQGTMVFFAALTFVVLNERGEQQMAAIGRGLMSRPKLMLLDEPSMGLAPMIVEEIFEIVQRLNQDQGVS